MKFQLALASIAALTNAAGLRQEDGTLEDASCYGEWIWEECSGLYYQEDYCSEDLGWWYAEAADEDWSDDWWVSAEEFITWDWCMDLGDDGEDDWDLDWEDWEDWEGDWEADWEDWEDDWDLEWDDDWEANWDDWEDDWDWENDWETEW